MNCQHAQSSFAALSVEEPSSPSMKELQGHLSQCPPCEREWAAFQQTLLMVSTTAQPVLTPERSYMMWQECQRRLMDKTESKRLAAQRSTPLGHWMKTQPTWGWIALGGAVAVLGAVWLSTPQNEVPQNRLVTAPVSMELVRFERPPAAASPLINHHSAMAFDPFTDHVGSTLVSYSATASGNASERAVSGREFSSTTP